MNEEELAALVVRLVGEGADYFAMLDQAAKALHEFGDHAHGAEEHTKGLSHAFHELGETVLHALETIGAGIGIWEAFRHFSEFETEQIRLKATLEANGRVVGETTEDYERFSKAIQEQTVVSEVQAISLLRLAESYDLTGEAAKEAVVKAMQFAGAVDGTAKSASSYMRVAQALEKGDIQGAMRAARRIPQLRQIRDETKFLETAERLLAAGQGVLSAEADTASGKLQMLNNEFHHGVEEVGGFVAEAIIPLIWVLKAVLGGVEELPEGVKRAITYISMLIVVLSSIKLLKGPVISALSAIKAAIVSAFTTTSLVAWTAALAGLIVVLGAVAVAYLLTKDRINQFKEASEKSVKASQFATAQFGKEAEDALERSKKMPDDQRKAFLEGNVKTLEATIKQERELLASLRKAEGERTSTAITRLVSPSTVAKHHEVFEAMSKSIDKSSEALIRFRAELKAISESAELPDKVAKSIREAAEKAAEDVSTVGMGDADKQMAKWQQQLEALKNKAKIPAQVGQLLTLKEGTDVIRENMTFQEKAMEQQDRLNSLFIAGAIDAETYARAMDKVYNRTMAAASATSTLAGSFASAEGLMAYQNKIEDLRRGGEAQGGKDQIFHNQKRAEQLLEQIRDAIKLKKEPAPIVIEESDIAD